MATNKSFGANVHKGRINPPKRSAGHVNKSGAPAKKTLPANGGGSPRRPITHTKRGGTG